MSHGSLYLWCLGLLLCFLLGLINSNAMRGSSNRNLLSFRRLHHTQAQIGEAQLFRLNMSQEDDREKKKKRRIIRYDNVGDPVYEGDEPSNIVFAGFDLGFSLDATSTTLLIFGLIAFNFLVLANADIPQFNFRF